MEGRDRNEHLLALKGYVFIMQINTHRYGTCHNSTSIICKTFEVTEFQKAQHNHNIEWDTIKLIYNELYTVKKK
jgi:hypothetical protein